MTKRKIAIVGSRTFPLPADIFESMEKEAQVEAVKFAKETIGRFIAHLSPIQNVVVSGGANGVDKWAAELAEERGIPVVVIRPNWKKYGKSAGFKRNGEIVEAADDVIAFWDGQSRGTLDTIKKAHQAVKPYCIIGPDGQVKLAVTDEAYLAMAHEGKPAPRFDLP